MTLSPPAGNERQERPQILVVDDEPDIRDIIVAGLDSTQYDVETAGDADSALERLEKGGIDGLILDLHLGGRDGHEVLVEARKLDEHLSIVIITGFATADSVITALRDGADDYIQKPFRLDELQASLERALRKWRLRLENRRLLDELSVANRELDRRVDIKTRSLKSLLEIAHEISGTLDLEQSLTGVAERARDVTGARGALLFLRQGNLDRYRLEFATGIGSNRETALVQSVEELVKRVAAEGRPWRSPLEESAVANAAPEGATLAVPLLWEGKAIGVLVLHEQVLPGGAEVDKTRPPVFTDEDEEMALGLATHAAVAIRNAQIYEEAGRLDRRQSAFIDAVSHELRTPLQLLKGPLEHLSTRYDKLGEDQRRQFIKKCCESAERLEDQVDLILLWAECGGGADRRQLERVNVGEAVEEAVWRMRQKADEKGVPLETNVPAELLSVHAQVRGLAGVLGCLLSNAIKFSADNPLVRLEVEKIGEQVRIHVVDRGIGIDPEDLPFIFGRFQQLDGSLTRQYGGTGLGLWVSKRLVEQYGGDIRVTSEPAKGSRFTIELPLLAEDTDRDEPGGRVRDAA